MPRWDVHFNMMVSAHDQDIVRNVARVHALASVIRGIPIPPYVQERLDTLNIVRAVRGTTGIEGTELTEEEVGEILVSPEGHRVLPRGREREEREVRNAEELMLFVGRQLTQSPHLPISEALIRRFHEIVTKGIDYEYNSPGRYRTFQVNAGSYLPPESGEDVRTLMSAFIEWFNSGPPTSWDPVIRAIAAHFFVVSTHPFGDGNGRTSRAVESYLLYQAGVNARGYYSLANYYYRHRSEYIGMLDHVRFRSDPDLTPFVAFALKGLVEELEYVHDEVLSEVRIIAFRDYSREMLTRLGKLGTPTGERQLRFLWHVADESVSLRELRARRHSLSALYDGMTNKTLMRDVNFLKQQGLVIVDGDKLEANLAIMTQYTA